MCCATVIPAKAGLQFFLPAFAWIPDFAGMTRNKFG